MGEEAGRILGDRAFILTHADAGRRVANDPAADDGIIAGKHRKLDQPLEDEALGAIAPKITIDHAIAIDEENVLTLAGIKRLLGVTPGKSRPRRIILEIGGEKVGVV